MNDGTGYPCQTIRAPHAIAIAAVSADIAGWTLTRILRCALPSLVYGIAGQRLDSSMSSGWLRLYSVLVVSSGMRGMMCNAGASALCDCHPAFSTPSTVAQMLALRPSRRPSIYSATSINGERLASRRVAYFVSCMYDMHRCAPCPSSISHTWSVKVRTIALRMREAMVLNVDLLSTAC